MRTQKKLAGLLCIAVLFVSAVTGELSGLFLNTGELGTTSGRCPGQCYWPGSCSSEIIVEPPGTNAQRSWCDGSSGTVWWCTEQETDVTDCEACEEMAPGECGQIVFTDMGTGYIDYTGIPCDACHVPGDGTC